jgi:plastocyanin
MNVLNTQAAHRRRILAIAAVLSAALSVSGCGESNAATPMVAAAPAVSASVRDARTAPASVAIRNFAFEPATLTVAAGSKVVWINRDEEPHVVVSAGAQFHASPALDTDDSYSTVFPTPGVYTYFCSIHPQMVGKIIVK